MKTCSRCGIEQSLEHFHRHTKRGHQHWCKACVSDYRRSRQDHYRQKSRDWYQAHRETEAQKQRLRKYGLSQEQFDALLTKQAGRCAACNAELKVAGDIDHCHATGRVRAVLCRRCNTTLGKYEENGDLIRRLARYADAC